ncbi:HlyD family type I secretion periplasmic adaptor subunit [Porphyrobacter sp. AAP82]|uniref:HlyD family type I secretion periplasmic adaptor subunit n=1 Tax=Porphyrobacter sp. AAP82 TaxID=1248917 RepID=UPI0002E30EBF|nr:HlyD family type I secretion periplasmic adaptor subunit [Porphyrobacter sp. AAP82]
MTPDFLFDADSPLPEANLKRRARIAYFSIGITAATMTALSTVVTVSGAVIAPGSLSASSQTKLITHPTGGVLSDLLVADGQHVSEGQVLLRLDTNVAQTTAAVSADSVSALAARRKRLEAELLGAGNAGFATIDPSGKNLADGTSLAREQELFQARRAETEAQVGMLVARLRQLEAEIAGHQSRIASLRKQQALLAPELEGLRKLYQQELVTINRLNEIERSDVVLRGEIAAAEAGIRQAQARITETNREISYARQNLRTSAGQELNEVVTELGEGRLRLVDAGDALERSTIRSPQSGVVDSVAYVTPGSFVPPGQTILRIVPDQDKLLAEVRVSPADIEQVRIGQDVRLRFSTLQLESSPEILGTVAFISPDRIEDPQTGQPYFKVKIDSSGRELDAVGKTALVNGMPLEAYIATGEQSLMSYLLKPLLDQIRKAFTQ